MFSTIDSHSLSSKTFVLGGAFTRFTLEPLQYILLQKFRGGGRRIIELFLKLGAAMPPALPVADPMNFSILSLPNCRRLKMDQMPGCPFAAPLITRHCY